MTKQNLFNSLNVFVIICSLLTFTISCQKNEKITSVERAFYYWKSTDIYNQELKQLNKLKVKKLYIKLFEIDYSESRGNFPYCKFKPSIYTFESEDSLKIIPTIFIKNEIFQFNNDNTLDKLADNIVFLINKYSVETGYDGKVKKLFEYNEIHIDCDWTKSTKDKYFYLLKKIKELSSKKVSCTLRLFPYKYPDIMGVPPVDKATLMCYNIIKPFTSQNKNSILDITELKKYLNENKSYPIHLDIALPTFYWSQLYQNNRFMNLIDLSTNDIKSFTKMIKPFWYQVQRDTNISYNIFLKAGDMLKCEDVSPQLIQEAIGIIKTRVNLDNNVTISLFDFDNNTLKQYTNEEISSFYNNFIQ